MNRTRITRIRIAIFGIPLVGMGVGLGCLGQAERTYFNDLGDGSIDGSTDGTTPPLDAATGIDVTAPSPDAQIEAGSDVADAGSDSPVEVGCGPTDTVANCGQCGAACDTTNSKPSSCSGGACKYTCNAGFGDCLPTAPNTDGCETALTTTTNCTGCGVACDTSHSIDAAACSATGCKYAGCAPGWRDCNTVAPNADGCECNAPACCDGGACQALHDNGLMLAQTFYDCTPLGQYNSSLAFKACIAYTGNAAQCVSFPCLDPDSGPIICSSGAAKNCMCWSFAGSNVGLVDNAGVLPGPGGKNCYCPDIAVGDLPWR